MKATLTDRLVSHVHAYPLLWVGLFGVGLSTFVTLHLPYELPALIVLVFLTSGLIMSPLIEPMRFVAARSGARVARRAVLWTWWHPFAMYRTTLRQAFQGAGHLCDGEEEEAHRIFSALEAPPEPAVRRELARWVRVMTLSALERHEELALEPEGPSGAASRFLTIRSNLAVAWSLSRCGKHEQALARIDSSLDGLARGGWLLSSWLAHLAVGRLFGLISREAAQGGTADSAPVQAIRRRLEERPRPVYLAVPVTVLVAACLAIGIVSVLVVLPIAWGAFWCAGKVGRFVPA
jgi:hypothetical protein